MLRLLIGILFVGATLANTIPQDGRIVNGQIVDITKAPYIVQLRTNAGYHFCGGSLVSSLHVVTAAHCFDTINPLEVIVVAGANTRSDVGVQRAVSGYRINPTYTRQTMDSDVAILKVNLPFLLSAGIRTIRLATNRLNVGEPITISGWGQTQQNSGMSNQLRVTKMPVISNRECEKRHSYLNPLITDNMFCAFNDGISSPCMGDSGGPIVYQNTLVGIVSWGRMCGSPEHPPVFACVATLNTFIINAIYQLQ